MDTLLAEQRLCAAEREWAVGGGGGLGKAYPGSPPVTADLPADLTEWVAGPELASLVLRLAQAADEADLHPAFSLQDSHFYSPWTMLGVLTYAYAVGIYRSDQVAALTSRDVNLCWLCQDEHPPGPVIQRFREKNRNLLQKVLARVLRVVLDRQPGRKAMNSALTAIDDMEAVRRAEILRATWLAQEAQVRIRRAEREDSSSLERSAS